MTAAANYEMRVASLGFSRKAFQRMVVEVMNDYASQVADGEWSTAAKMVYESCRSCMSPERMVAQKHWLARCL